MKLTYLAISLSLAGTAIAPENNTKCKDQLKKICGKNYATSTNLGNCLQDNAAKMSPECRPRRVDFAAIKQQCAPEIATHCAGMDSESRLYQCLRQKMRHDSKAVSAACTTRMNG